jgi:Xaa-Pro aminopeptidase
MIEPHLPVDQYQRESDVVMKEVLLQLGLLTSGDDVAGYRKYFPHAISHGVGIDVHDNLGAPHFFQPGMVLAVEPGVYIEAERIGMRLHDIVQITESGHVNLSKRLSTDL